ncbi:MAG TPA: aliphatic sulfonates ABC transporter substrate-binding protein, partial [Naasia sp.]
MPRTDKLRILVPLGTVALLALSGCAAGEGSAVAAEPSESPAAAEGWSSDELNIDFATYNPLSLIIKDQGWLEEATGGDVT